MSETSDESVDQFLNITGTIDRKRALEYLLLTDGDLNEAVTAFLESGDAQEDEDMAEATSTSAASAQPTSSRAMNVASSASSHKQPAKRSKAGINTLGSIANQSDSDDDDDKPTEFYTGGEKSGLGVLDPNSKKRGAAGGVGPKSLIEQIMRKAQQQGEAPEDEGDEGGPASSKFKGAGYTLGSDEQDSTKVEDPNAAFRRAMETLPPKVTRILKLWQDGFSVDDGPLFRYDDPANKEYLEAINQGRAPLALLNVQFGQPVDVTVQKLDDNYKAPVKVAKPFEGSGHRLGSEMPPTTSSTTPTPATSQTQAAGTTQAQATMEVDSAQPQTQLNIRLAAGGRLVSAFNTTHTLADVYAFIDRAAPDAAGRAYILLTPFPRKEYPRDGADQTLEAAGLLKGTLQQKFL